MHPDLYRTDSIKVRPDTDPALISEFMCKHVLHYCDVWRASFSNIHCRAMKRKARTVRKVARIENMWAVSPEYSRYEACRECKR
jgi:hypothetical protein